MRTPVRLRVRRCVRVMPVWLDRAEGQLGFSGAQVEGSVVLRGRIMAGGSAVWDERVEGEREREREKEAKGKGNKTARRIPNDLL